MSSGGDHDRPSLVVLENSPNKVNEGLTDETKINKKITCKRCISR